MDVYKEWLGIPDGERPPDHYQLLRLVRFEDDAAKIQAHYKKLNAHVRKYATGPHSVRSQELLNELAKAMLCLTDPQRKREYDESLGREFEDDQQDGQRSLEEHLVADELITRDQAREARSFADARGLSMRDAVVQLKLVDAETAARTFARELQRPYVDLAEMVPDDSVLDQVPRNFVKRHEILPLFVDDDMLLVACVHEPSHQLEDDLRLRYGVPIRTAIATPLAVRQAIAKYYAPGMRDEAVSAAAAGNTSGEASSSAGKGGSAGPATRQPMSELTPEAAAERKQLGILFMCWGVILPILLDEFLVKNFLPSFLVFPYVPSITTLIFTPLAIWWVLKVYWK